MPAPPANQEIGDRPIGHERSITIAMREEQHATDEATDSTRRPAHGGGHRGRRLCERHGQHGAERGTGLSRADRGAGFGRARIAGAGHPERRAHPVAFLRLVRRQRRVQGVQPHRRRHPGGQPRSGPHHPRGPVLGPLHQVRDRIGRGWWTRHVHRPERQPRWRGARRLPGRPDRQDRSRPGRDQRGRRGRQPGRRQVLHGSRVAQGRGHVLRRRSRPDAPGDDGRAADLGPGRWQARHHQRRLLRLGLLVRLRRVDLQRGRLVRRDRDHRRGRCAQVRVRSQERPARSWTPTTARSTTRS